MDIKYLINRFELNELPRLNKLKNYIDNKPNTTGLEKESGKPCNKILHNYAKDITTNTVGYFLGKPITYDTKDENLAEEIKKITIYNDDDTHNTEIGEDLSIYGVAYELIYLDEDKEVRYTVLSPRETFIIYDNSVEKNILYGIRFYDVYENIDDRDTVRYVEVYDDKNIYKYRYSGTMELMTSTPHYFGQVPINVYYNNKDKKGDFEDVITEIDAYNIMQSESINDFQQFADAYLQVSGLQVDEETIDKMRDKRILVTDEGSASWLVKQTNDVYIENIKNRLDKDIYKFSNTVNMSDENFANNLSGVAIKYKLMKFENRIAKTENYYRKGLLRRWELICNILNLKGGKYNFTDITFTFTRNIPANLTDIATMTQQLKGTVSQKTLLKQIPFIDDINIEMEQLQDESDYLFNEENDVNE